MSSTLVPGDRLTSGTSCYLVQSFLGEGSFGKVAKCKRMDNMKTIAIKMMNRSLYVNHSNAEVAALMKIKSFDPDKCNIVRWYGAFTDRGQICLEFEHLDKNLSDFMMERYPQPFLLVEIRPIVQQIANALSHLKAAGIIHADLKLENVMLVDHVREPFKVKLIDFGLAFEVSAATLGSHVQTRPYRSPEIILGLPFTEAIDMWSLGCIAATMYLGTLFYPCMSEYDMLRFIVETQGQPPDNMLNAGFKSTLYFQKVNSAKSAWKLKAPRQVYNELGIQAMETRTLKFKSLDDLLYTWCFWAENDTAKVAEMNDRSAFVDMLKGMLHLEATKRITPQAALEHPFISMQHIAGLYHHSNHVKLSFHIMSQVSDSGKGASGPPQVSPSSTTTIEQDSVLHNMVKPQRSHSRHFVKFHDDGTHILGKRKRIDTEDVHKKRACCSDNNNCKVWKKTADSSNSIPVGGKRKLEHDQEDLNETGKSHHERKKARQDNVEKSTRCNCDLLNYFHDQSGKRSEDNQWRVRGNLEDLPTSRSKCCNHSCVSLARKRKHCQNSDDKLHQETKQAKLCSPDRSKNNLIHTGGHPQEVRLSDENRKVHRTSADLSTPSYRSQNNSHVSLGFKRRLDNGQNDDEHDKSLQEWKRFKECFEERFSGSKHHQQPKPERSRPAKEH